jgi:hypothetical protein
MSSSATPSNDSWPPAAALGRCPVYGRNEILVSARSAVIRRHLSRASAWPQWFPYCTGVRLAGSVELALGVRFEWRTFDVNVASQCWNGNRTGV